MRNGKWVISDQQDGTIVHVVESHYPEGTSAWRNAESGLFRKIDFDNHYVSFVPTCGKIPSA